MAKDFLYHYTSLEGLKGIINEKAIRPTHIRYLNDETEFAYTSRLLRGMGGRLNDAATSKIHKSTETLLAVVESVEKSHKNGIMGRFFFSASITTFPTIRYFDLAVSSISSYFELSG
jgi:hypothetical protein